MYKHNTNQPKKNNLHKPFVAGFKSGFALSSGCKRNLYGICFPAWIRV